MIDLYADDVGNKNIAGIKKYFGVTHPIVDGPVDTELYICDSLIHICIIYLHVKEVCLKVTIAMFYFCHSKNPSNIMKIFFNSISIFSRKKFPCLQI